MASGSAIEWTDDTWTLVTGCDVVSPACAHCYAREFAPRLQAMERARREDPAVPRPGEKYQTDSTRPSSGVGFEVVCHERLLDWPTKLRRGRLIFVTSMGDLFHERVPFDFIERAFETMAATPRHTYQVLTKRPHIMRRFFEERDVPTLSNVWLGVTVENATWARRRIPDLTAVPAAVHFLSMEPLLGDVADTLDLADIEWVIAGGESGHRHRRTRVEWLRAVRDVCEQERVPFFFKQWGGRTPKAGGRELDGRVYDQFPALEAVAAC